MNCYFHPQVEGVVSCGKCGVAMCKECEGKAFMRLPSGQALCNRCSLNEAEASVADAESWMKRNLIRIIIMSILVGLGLIFLLTKELEFAIVPTVLCWLIAGIIGNIGLKSQDKSSGIIVKTIWTTVLSPISLISYIIGYFRTKDNYKQGIQLVEAIKAAGNN